MLSVKLLVNSRLLKWGVESYVQLLLWGSLQIKLRTIMMVVYIYPTEFLQIHPLV